MNSKGINLGSALLEGRIAVSDDAEWIVCRKCGQQLFDVDVEAAEGDKLLAAHVCLHKASLPIETVLADLAKAVPQEEWDKLPSDLTDKLEG